MLHAILPILPILLFLLHVITKLTNNNKTRGLHPLLPGPSPWPILGCLPEMCRNRPAYRWVHRIMEERGAEIACVRLGNCHVIAVRSPEMAREFLKKHDAVFASRPETMATRILSRGYITTGVVPQGEQWRKMRKVLVSNVFNPSNMRWLLRKRNLEADNLVRFIYNQCSKGFKGGVVNVRSAAQHYSASVIRRILFNKRHFGEGQDNGGPGFEDLEHVEAVGTMNLHVYAFSVSDYLPWLERLDLDGHRKKVCDAMRVIKKYQDPIVNDRIRQWRDGTKTEPEDLLDVFISLKDAINGKSVLCDEEIQAQITELFLAGMDNTYNTAEWTVSEMLNRPEIMKKAAEEVDRAVGRDRLVEESDIPELRYLTACVREALRLHPVSPFNLPHTSTADCTVAGYFIPKGSSVLISRLGLGRNPRIWDDPLRFDPGSHVAGDGRRVDLAEDELRFVTFSMGRRGCTSVGLGSNMIMMLLARLLQAFSWEIPDGSNKIDLREAVTLFKAEPLVALAKPRLSASVYLSLESE